MKNVFVCLISIILGLTLLAACAKYDYHSQVEITDETQNLDMHDSNIG